MCEPQTKNDAADSTAEKLVEDKKCTGKCGHCLRRRASESKSQDQRVQLPQVQ